MEITKRDNKIEIGLNLEANETRELLTTNEAKFMGKAMVQYAEEILAEEKRDTEANNEIIVQEDVCPHCGMTVWILHKPYKAMLAIPKE